MSEEDAFLAGIEADRADRTRLLVFADWLAERNDPREEFVRTHEKLLQMDGTEPEFAELEKTWAIWTGGVALLPGYLPGGAPTKRLDDCWVDSFCRVFTVADLATGLASRSGEQQFIVNRYDYEQMDHIETSGEESLTLYHGKPENFGSHISFVAATILRDLWDDPFQVTPPATEPVAQRFLAPVTMGSFWRRWRGLRAGLRNPPALPVLTADNHFLGAQYIEGDWNNWAFVAIHQHDWFALFWATTA